MSKTLSDRMKEYENISRNYLTRKIPVIIRVDGKAFHTFTKGLDKPIDRSMYAAMLRTMKYLCENIQGCILGYMQSDEISLVLTDYKSIESDPWFGYNIQKMASVSASMATVKFNAEFRKLAREKDEHIQRKFDTALFDSRCFNIPKEEVINYLIWRQRDYHRNIVQALGRQYYSHSELEGKNSNEVIEMLSQKGVIFEDLQPSYRLGTWWVKQNDGYWDVAHFDFAENRDWVNSLIYMEDE